MSLNNQINSLSSKINNANGGKAVRLSLLSGTQFIVAAFLAQKYRRNCVVGLKTHEVRIETLRLRCLQNISMFLWHCQMALVTAAITLTFFNALNEFKSRIEVIIQ